MCINTLELHLREIALIILNKKTTSHKNGSYFKSHTET